MVTMRAIQPLLVWGPWGPIPPRSELGEQGEEDSGGERPASPFEELIGAVVGSGLSLAARVGAGRAPLVLGADGAADFSGSVDWPFDRCGLGCLGQFLFL